jgi:hypothetical protein
MRRVIGSALVAAGLALAPALAAAQHTMNGMKPDHEAGVDISFAYFKASGASGIFTIATPVDLRLGFVMASGWSLEPRLGLAFASGGGASAHNINLDLNALFPLGGTYRKGAYFTVGAGADFVGSTGNPSGTLMEFNGGIGTRVPYESGAIRLEAYGKYHLKNTTLFSPNTLEIGARVGLSLWH